MLRTHQPLASLLTAKIEPTATATSRAQQTTERSISAALRVHAQQPSLIAVSDTELAASADAHVHLANRWHVEQVVPDDGEQADDGTAHLSGRDGVLKRDLHLRYLRASLVNLPSSFVSLDASRPWLCYWTVNSLHLLGDEIESSLALATAAFLGRCQNISGGFGGGPGQMSHLAPTYAAICALATLGVEEGFELIDRPGLLAWLLSLKRPSGAFCMQRDGEADLRACYCAVHVAYMADVLTPDLALGVGEFVASCQSWDGGLGAVPSGEAHGGYTFCGLACMVLLGETHKLDLDRLLHWAAHRQMRVEGGFQGRTNKLVDGCYSFWQGGVFPILSGLIKTASTAVEDLGAYVPGMYYSSGSDAAAAAAAAAAAGENENESEIESGGDGAGAGAGALLLSPLGDLLCHQTALQDYIYFACQDERGGLRDKPEMSRDLYHSCYVLAGLSVAQHNLDGTLTLSQADRACVLRHIDPVLAIGVERAGEMLAYFRRR